jgi:hypothetical protein
MPKKKEQADPTPEMTFLSLNDVGRSGSFRAQKAAARWGKKKAAK